MWHSRQIMHGTASWHSKRILIIDWDVHHGNGTQDIFYADPDVTFVSVHRYGGRLLSRHRLGRRNWHWPRSGPAHQCAVAAEYVAKAYRERFREAVERADRCKPQLIILSAGFDAHRDDPIGGFTLGTEDFVELTQFIVDVANTHSNGKLVSCLEGGYNLQALADSVAGHLEALLAADVKS